MLPRVPGGLAEEPLGLEVLTYLQQHVVQAKVVVLTSIEWQDEVRLKILRTGIYIQDYLSKTWDHAIERLAQSVWRLVIELERGVTCVSTEGPPVVHHVQLDDGQPSLVWIDGIRVKLPPGHYELLHLLAEARNTPVDRGFLIDKLWTDPNRWPDDINNALAVKMNQLKRAIRQQTQNQINPDHLIRSYDGVYWLQAIVSLNPLMVYSDEQRSDHSELHHKRRTK